MINGKRYRYPKRKTAAVLLAFLLTAVTASGCTDVGKWGVTNEASSNMASPQAAGPASENSQEESPDGDDPSNWEYDIENLYIEDIDFESYQDSEIELLPLGSSVFSEHINVEITVTGFELFEDADGSGRHGIALFYTLSNESNRIVQINGASENAGKFAMFSPDRIALAQHWNMVTPPDDDYDLRITYPNATQRPSMASFELAGGESVEMYRVYDFAGAGTYILYLSTSLTQEGFLEEAVQIRIAVE